MSKNVRPIIIGVAGGTGSGKTTVSQAILQHVGPQRIAYIQHDSYYHDLNHLSLEERALINFDHPDSLDNALLIEHLDALCSGRSVHVPIYDFTHYNRLPETMLVEPHPVILVEGILIFSEAELRDRMDVKIYVDTDADLRFIRRLQRDIRERGRSIESVIEQYLHTVRPMHLEFVEPTKRYADIIIPRGGLNSIAIDMVVARIERLLDQAPPVLQHEEQQPPAIDAVRVPGEEFDLQQVQEH
ncbi:MAG: uridine kinase [Herpetosiphonaceae bacterium]|nr:MAG: uridine kinase [Herpetosiphonaceae bacterium]